MKKFFTIRDSTGSYAIANLGASGSVAVTVLKTALQVDVSSHATATVIDSAHGLICIDYDRFTYGDAGGYITVTPGGAGASPGSLAAVDGKIPVSFTSDDANTTQIAGIGVTNTVSIADALVIFARLAMGSGYRLAELANYSYFLSIAAGSFYGGYDFGGVYAASGIDAANNVPNFIRIDNPLFQIAFDDNADFYTLYGPGGKTPLITSGDPNGTYTDGTTSIAASNWSFTYLSPVGPAPIADHQRACAELNLAVDPTNLPDDVFLSSHTLLLNDGANGPMYLAMSLSPGGTAGSIGSPAQFFWNLNGRDAFLPCPPFGMRDSALDWSGGNFYFGLCNGNQDLNAPARIYRSTPAVLNPQLVVDLYPSGLPAATKFGLGVGHWVHDSQGLHFCALNQSGENLFAWSMPMVNGYPDLSKIGDLSNWTFCILSGPFADTSGNPYLFYDTAHTTYWAWTGAGGKHLQKTASINWTTGVVTWTDCGAITVPSSWNASGPTSGMTLAFLAQPVILRDGTLRFYATSNVSEPPYGNNRHVMYADAPAGWHTTAASPGASAITWTNPVVSPFYGFSDGDGVFQYPAVARISDPTAIAALLSPTNLMAMAASKRQSVINPAPADVSRILGADNTLNALVKQATADPLYIALNPSLTGWVNQFQPSFPGLYGYRIPANSIFRGLDFGGTYLPTDITAAAVSGNGYDVPIFRRIDNPNFYATMDPNAGFSLFGPGGVEITSANPDGTADLVTFTDPYESASPTTTIVATPIQTAAAASSALQLIGSGNVPAAILGYSLPPETAGYPTTIGGFLDWLRARFANRVVLDNTSNTLKVYKQDGTTVMTTQTTIANPHSQTQGKGS